uniref:Putative ATP-dependent RNA helicase TDRD12 n=1 Tax=Dromaius novaehollandiae TaxID=8790 RepID=A0A8C4PE58_DRONO
MMEVLILEIEDPGCFWVTVKGCGPYVVNEIEYKNLNAEMNQFYDKSCQDADEIKPLTLQEGQICVVFSKELKCWCRAAIKSIMSCTDHYLTECFLVDYAKYIFVKSNDIRVAVEAFMKIPYRAKQCGLYRTKPVTLHINFCEDTAKIVPAKRWDCAATQYFQSLLKATTQVKARLCAIEGNKLDVLLYVTIKNEKVCVNDDLVSKNFARFEEGKENTEHPANDRERQTSLNVESPLPLKIVNPALAFSPVLFQEKVSKYLETGEHPVYQKQSYMQCPNFTESYCWPPIARGCDVLAISHQGNDPLLYIPPVLTFLQSESCYTSLPNRSGPLALIVCPGWKKAQLVFELLKTYSRCSRPLHPMLIIVGQNKEEARNVKIHRGCEIIVTTPYSLLRLLEHHSLLLLRLCHLIFDEIEVLFSEASEQVFTILDYYRKTVIIEERLYSPHQIVAVGTCWNKHITHLLKEFMNDPYIVITAIEEASICGNVQQVVQLCLNSERIAVLLRILDFTPNNVEKMLIFTSTINEAQMVHQGSFVDQEYTKARSVLLLTENNVCHALGVLHYLKHAEAEIPPELHDFTARVLEAEEEKKLARPLCTYLKTLGICKNRRACPDRHHINVQTDIPQNIPDKITPTPGCMTVMPLHIVSATNYFGRIVDKQKDQYAILAEEINEYFKKPNNNISVEKVEKLALYGLYEETFFHRVQVVEISPKKEEKLFFNVTIKYIDEGRMSQVESHQLLQLPARFQCLPPQAVEFIVCSVKPIDNEIEWNPRVTSHIYHKIKGKPHEAKMVLTLGNTVWVDPMVRVTRLSNLKTYVNEYNVRSEILSMGLGTDNPEHIKQLQKLYALLTSLNISQWEIPNISTDTFLLNFIYFSFYPEIKWFQNEETVTVKVKIASIADYKCKFSKEKVVFSACSGDKFYLADMELHQHILVEKSACVIKDKEAIIVLAKEKRQSWCKLLKNKNPHVSFDFEHWEDFEDKSPFPIGKKRANLHCPTVVTEELMNSSEDSGTESDD